MLQRDGFIEEIKYAIRGGGDVLLLSADFGASALDELRDELPNNFVHCGISEQNMVDVAIGLALEDKIVFCYAMAPFISLRAVEQIKQIGIMNLPICLISVGVGIGYADSGPTHYVTEEFACMRSIVGCNIYTAADTVTARQLASRLLAEPRFSYVRLDRHFLPELSMDCVTEEFRQLGDSNSNKIALVSHGKMTHECIKAFEVNQGKYVVYDIIQSKPFSKEVVGELRKCRGVVVVDEQTPAGSLGAAVFEACSEQNFWPKIVNITLPEMYFFENGGREYLHKKHGLSFENIVVQSNRI